MKKSKLLTGLILMNFIVCNLVYADCTSGGFTVWPYGRKIIPNQQIMLEGSGAERDMVFQMGKDFVACLWSGIDQVELQVVEVCKGEWGLTQAILQPVSELVVGRSYRMLLETKERGPNLGFSRELGHAWVVGDKQPDTRPIWKSSPKLVGKHFRGLGCGNDIGVRFRIDAQPTKSLRVKAEVRAKGAKRWRAYFLTMSEGMVEIGHSMCIGAFDIERNPSSEVKFTLVDPAGNMIPQPGPAIQFEPPRKTDI